MSFRLLIVNCLLVGSLTACSTKPSTSNEDLAQAQPEAPASYEEYKEWRQQHDPQGKAYAEFKEWEIQYRRWKAQQNQTN